MKPEGTTLIRFDSEYAAHMATGLWKPKSNVQLVEGVQKALTDARRVASVAFMHVKGHAGIKGNEEADRLASKGRVQARATEVVWRAATADECRIEFGEPTEMGKSESAGREGRSKMSVKVRAVAGRARKVAKKKRA